MTTFPSPITRFLAGVQSRIGGRYCTPPVPGRCTDCSGLVAEEYARVTGKTISADSHLQYTLGHPVRGEWLPGDLLFYDTMHGREVRHGNRASHVGVYLGDGRAVHAMNPRQGIIATATDTAYWNAAFLGARRLPFGEPSHDKATAEALQGEPSPAVSGENPGALPTVTPNTPFRQTGNTDRASFRAALSRTIGGPSPLAPEADAIYDALAPLGLTRLGAAMAWIERRNETDPGGLAFYPRAFHNLWAVKNPGGSWRRFGSYAEAAQHWGSYLLGPTYADQTTIADLISRYAPGVENDTTRYIRQVVAEIDLLPLRDEPPKEPPVETWAPLIYDLANDSHAARFGLTPAERNSLLDRCIAGRAGKRPEIIVLHVQWGNTSGSLDWWVNGRDPLGNPIAASATVTVQRDQSILKVIPNRDGPWTNGDVKRPDAHARRIIQRFGPDPNVYSLTIEAEDLRTEDVTPEQERAIKWKIRDWWREFPWLAGADWQERILRHAQINSVDRANCGTYRDRIVRQLRAEGGPGAIAPAALAVEFPGLPDWLPADGLRAAFPLADPRGVVTKELVTWIAATGEVPYFIEKLDLGRGRNLWRFDRVTLLNDGTRVWQEGEAA